MEGGGAERQVTYLVNELARNGHDVHVALVREGSNFQALRSTGATIHRLGPCSNHDPRLLLRLTRTIAAIKPDVCQCWLPQMVILGGVACLWTGTPWLFSERSSERAYTATLKNRLRVRIASFADGIVSNSVQGNEYWHGHVGARVPRFVIPNGLPLDEIAAAPVASEAELDLREGEALILHAGRLVAGKNAEVLLRALARLRLGTPFRALLCGDGPQRSFLENLLIELGLTDRVRIVPYATKLWSIMKRASVLVSSSRYEGSPNVVLEGMACGCPLVVSDIPAHRELLDEHSARFAHPDDPELMAICIADAISDRPAARARAAAASARASRYELHAVTAQYVHLYREVVALRGRAFPLRTS
jgi:glycosyltransferase involved in cell wall biosynthesis